MYRRKSRKGATSVEIAFVLPIIFFLFFSFWEWSRVEMIKQACSTATFEAARRGTIPSATTGDMNAIANNTMAIYFIDGAKVNSSINLASSTSSVSISVPLENNLWCGPYLFGGKILTSDYSLGLEVQPD